jgi:hypothetical protein
MAIEAFESAAKDFALNEIDKNLNQNIRCVSQTP